MKKKRFIILLILATIISVVLAILLVLNSFSANNKASIPIEPYRSWWQTTVPDLVIGPKKYYTRTCTLVEVDTQSEYPVPETIFKPPTRLIASCMGSDPLTYKDGYIIFGVCRTDFGAGGCGRERYRSNDMVNWQEDIGITWVKGEQHTAWRKLGSTSSKADAVSRVE